MTYSQFPKGFLFGVATAAYQIEGGWNSDGKGLSTWAVLAPRRGKRANGDTSDVACNTYHDFQTDFDITKAHDQGQCLVGQGVDPLAACSR